MSSNNNNNTNNNNDSNADQGNNNNNNTNNRFFSYGFPFSNMPGFFPFDFQVNGRQTNNDTNNTANTDNNNDNDNNNNNNNNTNIPGPGEPRFNFFNGGIPGISAVTVNGDGSFEVFTGNGAAGGDGLMALLSNIFNVPYPHSHKHASEHYMKTLKPLKLKDLKPDDMCPICFEPYNEYLTEEEKQELKSKDENMSVEEWKLKQQAEQEAKEKEKLKLQTQIKDDANSLLNGFNVEEDPAIEFPLDNTARESIHYNTTLEETARQEESSTQSEELAEGEDEETNNTEKEKKEEGETDTDAHYAVELPQCKHHFGYSCIAEWLKSNVSCPLCRSEAEAAEGESSARATASTGATVGATAATGTAAATASASASASNTPTPGPTTSNNTTETNHNNGSGLIYYPVALTEIYIPIDWTGPRNSGINPDDPPINFPQESADPMPSFGRRTGPPIPPSTNTNSSSASTGTPTSSTSNNNPITNTTTTTTTTPTPTGDNNNGNNTTYTPRVIFRTTISTNPGSRGASATNLRSQRHHPYFRSSTTYNNSTINENFTNSNNNSRSGSRSNSTDTPSASSEHNTSNDNHQGSADSGDGGSSTSSDSY